VAVLTATHRWVVRLMVLSAVLAVAAVYVGVHIGSWVPADDGTLSQSALRVMQGQLPHRDFGEIYTGSLSIIHALAFRASCLPGKQRKELCRRFGMDTQGNASPIFWLGDLRACKLPSEIVTASRGLVGDSPRRA